MGEVYRGRDTRLNRTVAIKVRPLRVANDPNARERFEREARVVATLNHPHICTLHDAGRQDGIDFVMELMEGETLAARLDRVRCRWRWRLNSLFRSCQRWIRRTAPALCTG